MSPNAHPNSGPALAMIVLSDIPVGLRALDALAKQAPVELFATGTIQCGRYLIAFGGQVEAVGRSHDAALAAASGSVLDQVLLAHVDERIVPAWRTGKVQSLDKGDTLGVIQVSAPPTLMRAVDVALKGALVELIELRIGDGLGGKAIATLIGETHDVQAAIALANEAIERGCAEGASTVVIPNIDAAVRSSLAEGTRFFKEWRG
ncbi:MAG: BMC domain-containing protein [Deltaproteobacteria bacterium]|nr:BMC domain-containing protein [Deltaproteobacteria bacterium]